MVNDNSTASTPDDELATDATAVADEALRVETYDIDHDGKISLIEGVRADLGIVDARLEEAAAEPGLKGKIADLAHHVVDKLDND